MYSPSEGHEEGVLGLAMSGDGTHVITASLLFLTLASVNRHLKEGQLTLRWNFSRILRPLARLAGEDHSAHPHLHRLMN